MHGNKPLSPAGRFFIVLLILSVALNGTQAVVLCLGSDGHVAIELAGHRHYESNHGSEEAKQETDAFATELQTCCGPCMDVPLTPGISEAPAAQKSLAVNALSADIALFVPEMTDHGLEDFDSAGTYPALTPFYAPLNTIILIV